MFQLNFQIGESFCKTIFFIKIIVLILTKIFKHFFWNIILIGSNFFSRGTFKKKVS